MSRPRRQRAALAVGGVAAAHWVPSVLTVPAVRGLVAPTLSGRAEPGADGRPAVALTFDDGPDPRSTPRFLEVLDELGVRATFFVLAPLARAHPALTRSIRDAGHELGLHGWSHRPHVLRPPAAVARDLVRAHAAMAAVVGTAPRLWRPPHGIVTGAGLATARALRMRPVLWGADGQDWRADASPRSVVDRIAGRLQPGGVVLLHDADTTSAPESWRTTLAAVPALVEHCRGRGWHVGPVDGTARDTAREHRHVP